MKYKKLILVFAVIVLIPFKGFTESPSENPYRFHELTLYVIPSTSPFDWSSPSSLLQSYAKGFIKKPFSSNKYILGHLFVQLSSPLLDEPVYTGMVNISHKDFRHHALKEKAGLGILGIAIDGKLEETKEIREKIQAYAKRDNIASVTYRLNEKSFRQVITFLEYYSSEDSLGHKPSRYYGGAFWPLYEYEGAGCTAFGMAMLSVAGIWEEEMSEWKVEVDIPIELIGGELNGGRAVKLLDILQTKQWHSGRGNENTDYVPFWIFEPTLIYNWIVSQTSAGNKALTGVYRDASANDMPRLFADFSDTDDNFNEPVITSRDDDNLFIRHFHFKNGLQAVHPEHDEFPEVPDN